jgi:hypothetical protein
VEKFMSKMSTAGIGATLDYNLQYLESKTGDMWQSRCECVKKFLDPV